MAGMGASPELTDLQPSAGIIGGALVIVLVTGSKTGACALPVALLRTGGVALLVNLARGGSALADAALAGACASSLDLDLCLVIALVEDRPLWETSSDHWF